MQITLARALKIKNILSGKLSKIQSTIQTTNSVVAGAEQPDVNALLEKRNSLVAFLIDLKSSIDAANRAIRKDIYTLAEVKSGLAFWTGISTTNGDTGQFHYGTSQKITYTAVIPQATKEAEIARHESSIEALQEKLDQHNYTTTLEVSDESLKLLGIN